MATSSPFGAMGSPTPPGVEGAPPQPQAPAPDVSDAMSAGKQLISQVAQIHSSLKGLAQAYPEMSQAIDKAIQALKEGMTKTVGGMQSKGSEGGAPPYA